MKIPNIRTTEGAKPVTILPDKLLVEGFLTMSINAAPEDKDLVWLLQYAEPNPEKNGEILRAAWKAKPGLFLYIPVTANKSLTARSP